MAVLKIIRMCYLGPWFCGGSGSTGLMNGLGDLRGLFQPKSDCDSKLMIIPPSEILEIQWPSFQSFILTSNHQAFWQFFFPKSVSLFLKFYPEMKGLKKAPESTATNHLSFLSLKC